MSDARIGLIGLAVMGQNLALNMADHGFRVAVAPRGTTFHVDWPDPRRPQVAV